jgi:hypothetical protein
MVADGQRWANGMEQRSNNGTSSMAAADEDRLAVSNSHHDTLPTAEREL